MNSPTPSSSSGSPSLPKKHTRHLSLHHERQDQRKRHAREEEMKRVLEYCREQNCRGYKAITELDLLYIKDPRTINQHLDGEVETENKMKNQRILTKEEEDCLVKYLINRNRACQGLTEAQVEGVVLNILRVRQTSNRQKRGRNSEPLSVNARNALAKKRVGKSFFRRLNVQHPQLRKKLQQRVSAKRGLQCTLETAISYLDELAHLLIKLGIAQLDKVEPGVWHGNVDLSRIWAHDETPQFINYGDSGQSKVKIYGGAGEDCNRMSTENRESVTVQPFSNFAGDLVMCQVIFSGQGMSRYVE